MIDYINAYIVKERSAAQQLVVGVGAKQTVENCIFLKLFVENREKV
jgi:hypothetical protein